MSLKWKGAVIALAVMGLVAAPSTGDAQDGVKFGITVFGGYNSYAMDDVNDAIDDLNADPDVTAAGISVDKISSGIGVGGGIQVWAGGDFLLSAEYERLMASTKDEGDVGGTPVSVELKVPANAFVLTGAYMFPATSKARFGSGAGLGYYSTSGTQEFSAPPLTFSEEATGSGMGYHILGVMDYEASKSVHLGIRVGYRIAETSDLEDSDGDKSLNLDGSEATADWSGVMSRVGLTFLFGTSE